MANIKEKKHENIIRIGWVIKFIKFEIKWFEKRGKKIKGINLTVRQKKKSSK